MTASLEPIVDAPTAGPGALNSSLTMLMQRRSISAVCGYSSLSIMFLSNDSAMSLSACGSIHVVTNVARFSRLLPSSSSSSWIRRYAVSASRPSAGIASFGSGATLGRPLYATWTFGGAVVRSAIAALSVES